MWLLAYLTSLFRVDETGKIIWANQAELDLLGYEKSEYIGRYLSEFHADEHISIDITARLARFETLKDYPAVLKTKTGALRVNQFLNLSERW